MSRNPSIKSNHEDFEIYKEDEQEKCPVLSMFTNYNFVTASEEDGPPQLLPEVIVTRSKGSKMVNTAPDSEKKHRTLTKKDCGNMVKNAERSPTKSKCNLRKSNSLPTKIKHGLESDIIDGFEILSFKTKRDMLSYAKEESCISKEQNPVEISANVNPVEIVADESEVSKVGSTPEKKRGRPKKIVNSELEVVREENCSTPSKEANDTMKNISPVNDSGYPDFRKKTPNMNICSPRVKKTPNKNICSPRVKKTPNKNICSPHVQSILNHGLSRSESVVKKNSNKPEFTPLFLVNDNCNGHLMSNQDMCMNVNHYETLPLNRSLNEDKSKFEKFWGRIPEEPPSKGISCSTPTHITSHSNAGNTPVKNSGSPKFQKKTPTKNVRSPCVESLSDRGLSISESIVKKNNNKPEMISLLVNKKFGMSNQDKCMNVNRHETIPHNRGSLNEDRNNTFETFWGRSPEEPSFKCSSCPTPTPIISYTNSTNTGHTPVNDSGSPNFRKKTHNKNICSPRVESVLDHGLSTSESIVKKNSNKQEIISLLVNENCKGHLISNQDKCTNVNHHEALPQDRNSLNEDRNNKFETFWGRSPEEPHLKGSSCSTTTPIIPHTNSVNTVEDTVNKPFQFQIQRESVSHSQPYILGTAYNSPSMNTFEPSTSVGRCSGSNLNNNNEDLSKRKPQILENPVQCSADGNVNLQHVMLSCFLYKLFTSFQELRLLFTVLGFNTSSTNMSNNGFDFFTPMFSGLFMLRLLSFLNQQGASDVLSEVQSKNTDHHTSSEHNNITSEKVTEDKTKYETEVSEQGTAADNSCETNSMHSNISFQKVTEDEANCKTFDVSESGKTTDSLHNSPCENQREEYSTSKFQGTEPEKLGMGSVSLVEQLSSTDRTECKESSSEVDPDRHPLSPSVTSEDSSPNSVAVNTETNSEIDCLKIPDGLQNLQETTPQKPKSIQEEKDENMADKGSKPVVTGGQYDEFVLELLMHVVDGEVLKLQKEEKLLCRKKKILQIERMKLVQRLSLVIQGTPPCVRKQVLSTIRESNRKMKEAPTTRRKLDFSALQVTHRNLPNKLTGKKSNNSALTGADFSFSQEIYLRHNAEGSERSLDIAASTSTSTVESGFDAEENSGSAAKVSASSSNAGETNSSPQGLCIGNEITSEETASVFNPIECNNHTEPEISDCFDLVVSSVNASADGSNDSNKPQPDHSVASTQTVSPDEISLFGEDSDCTYGGTYFKNISTETNAFMKSSEYVNAKEQTHSQSLPRSTCCTVSKVKEKCLQDKVLNCQTENGKTRPNNQCSLKTSSSSSSVLNENLTTSTVVNSGYSSLLWSDPHNVTFMKTVPENTPQLVQKGSSLPGNPCSFPMVDLTVDDSPSFSKKIVQNCPTTISNTYQISSSHIKNNRKVFNPIIQKSSVHPLQNMARGSSFTGHSICNVQHNMPTNGKSNNCVPRPCIDKNIQTRPTDSNQLPVANTMVQKRNLSSVLSNSDVGRLNSTAGNLPVDHSQEDYSQFQNLGTNIGARSIQINKGRRSSYVRTTTSFNVEKACASNQTLYYTAKSSIEVLQTVDLTSEEEFIPVDSSRSVPSRNHTLDSPTIDLKNDTSPQDGFHSTQKQVSRPVENPADNRNLFACTYMCGGKFSKPVQKVCPDRTQVSHIFDDSFVEAPNSRNIVSSSDVHAHDLNVTTGGNIRTSEKRFTSRGFSKPSAERVGVNQIQVNQRLEHNFMEAHNRRTIVSSSNARVNDLNMRIGGKNRTCENKFTSRGKISKPSPAENVGTNQIQVSQRFDGNFMENPNRRSIISSSDVQVRDLGMESNSNNGTSGKLFRKRHYPTCTTLPGLSTTPVDSESPDIIPIAFFHKKRKDNVPATSTCKSPSSYINANLHNSVPVSSAHKVDLGDKFLCASGTNNAANSCALRRSCSSDSRDFIDQHSVLEGNREANKLSALRKVRKRTLSLDTTETVPSTDQMQL